MHKGRYKVSDVCQLLDKSKYPATQTKNGVTFTNNGDGSYTLNGTVTSNHANIFLGNTDVINNHIYLLTGSPTGDISYRYFINNYFKNSKGWVKDNLCYGGVDGIIYTGMEGVWAVIHVSVEPNTAVSNLTFKPQLFDLTEMYGAGNEPNTVAEFREKFSNDLYPYSPYCWASIRKLKFISDNNFINLLNISNTRTRTGITSNIFIQDQLLHFTSTAAESNPNSFNSGFYAIDGSAQGTNYTQHFNTTSSNSILLQKGKYTFKVDYKGSNIHVAYIVSSSLGLAWGVYVLHDDDAIDWQTKNVVLDLTEPSYFSIACGHTGVSADVPASDYYCKFSLTSESISIK